MEETNKVISDDLEKVDSINETDKVDYKTFQRLLAQRKADQAKMSTLESQIASLSEKEERLKQLEEEKNKQEGNWKAVLETRESDLEKYKNQLKETREELSTYVNEFQKSVKIQALEKHLGAKIADQSYYGLIDFDKIAITENGEVEDSTAKSYASEFLSKHSRLLDTTKPRIESRAPQGSTVSKKLESMTAQETAEYIKKLHSEGKI